MANWPDPALARALVRWQRAAGPYWPYVCAAPFLGRVALSFKAPARTQPARALADRIDMLAIDARVAVFVDLAATVTLPATALFNQLGFVVVPIIQRWVAAPAVVRCERLLELLILCRARAIKPEKQRGVVFLLDGERAGRPAARTMRPRAFDNRYVYRVDRFPAPDFLQGAGTSRVAWLGPTTAIATDLQPYALKLLAAGLAVEVRPVCPALPVALEAPVFAP